MNQISEICEYLGVNQKKLAEIIGVSQNTVSTWKSGKQKLPSWTKNIFQLLKDRKECENYKKTVKELLKS